MESNDNDFDNYQVWAETTVAHGDAVYPVLGLAGETGEFVERVKKKYRTDGGDWAAHLSLDELYDLSSELGDILWYVTRIASVLGVRLSNVVATNVEKLEDRRVNGK